MSEIKKIVTRVSKVESEEADKIKFRDTENTLYTIWKSKKDGSVTQASEHWTKIPDKFGADLEISYSETPYEFTGKKGETITGTHKNVLGFKWTAIKAGITQPAVMAKKIETDKVLREDVKEKVWGDRTADIKYGLAWNCASRIIATNPDIHNAVSVFNLADRVKVLADAIFSRINIGPTVDVPTKSDIPNKKKEEVAKAIDFIDEMYELKDYPPEDKGLPEYDEDLSSIPF